MRGRMLCQEASKDALSKSRHLTSYTANAWEAPKVHKDVVRPCPLVTVLSRPGCKASSVTAATAPSGSPSAGSVSMDMWTLGVLQKQESEGEEAFWLAGLAGRETPQQERGRLPQTAESQDETLRCLFRRRSQAVQLPLIKAFPVLEVIVQVLHKIGEVCKGWREARINCKVKNHVLKLLN